ncbi:MAG: ribosome-associated translation inhibitor RaiA [Deltaproteobacteria bacterium]|jgi:putative sigma-54 modulation protein|uniref:Ribosome hibernation promoting factor n=1 Tax=Candidatus Desulfacyla euxinica TaxID=2841693 RepID=A0A8J6T5Y6_9DELT|nr:ribosome-associated translation inhibitor RaiA [Candidatus Desulfacyla euxinica]MBL7216830.1 ribosome-associated translation inhibitor RaiA [Desulfobacteraceae bacterium]MBW1868469.1 ribosome-associated translation inhibitor RaiA [Deltaproteobacteria bacterium]MBW2203361.1 ribosome-associated translation inhibitor RaiA [Deltaproteobacteria bacterium]HIJ58235.1 ribosome-associated translation inhibitor RaiA [Deltaproteobacteria bacterium]
MDITVTFRHTEPIESLRTYAEEKVSKIEKYLDVPLDAHIVLTVEKFRHMADVSLRVNGTPIKAVEETGDMYSAIDQVMDKIENRVKKHISKIRNHRQENAKGESDSANDEENDTTDAVQDGPVIEVEEMVAKPMDPEEAAMQLNLLKQDFLVFRNAKSREINVIYNLANGNLGLIMPG